MKAVEDQRNKSKTQVTRLGMMSEQRVRNLAEEMNKLRENLGMTEKNLGDLRRQLDKEVSRLPCLWLSGTTVWWLRE